MGWRYDLCQLQTQAQAALEQGLKETMRLLLRRREGGHHSALATFSPKLEAGSKPFMIL